MLNALSFSLKSVLLPGVSTIVVGFLCQLVRQYIRRINDERLRAFLEQLVKAAAQIYGSGEGAAKYEYVVRQAQHRGYQVSRADVEAVVHDLNAQEK